MEITANVKRLKDKETFLDAKQHTEGANISAKVNATNFNVKYQSALEIFKKEKTLKNAKLLFEIANIWANSQTTILRDTFRRFSEENSEIKEQHLKDKQNEDSNGLFSFLKTPQSGLKKQFNEITELLKEVDRLSEESNSIIGEIVEVKDEKEQEIITRISKLKAEKESVTTEEKEEKDLQIIEAEKELKEFKPKQNIVFKKLLMLTEKLKGAAIQADKLLQSIINYKKVKLWIIFFFFFGDNLIHKDKANNENYKCANH